MDPARTLSDRMTLLCGGRSGSGVEVALITIPGLVYTWVRETVGEFTAAIQTLWLVPKHCRFFTVKLVPLVYTSRACSGILSNTESTITNGSLMGGARISNELTERRAPSERDTLLTCSCATCTSTAAVGERKSPSRKRPTPAVTRTFSTWIAALVARKEFPTVTWCRLLLVKRAGPAELPETSMPLRTESKTNRQESAVSATSERTNVLAGAYTFSKLVFTRKSGTVLSIRARSARDVPCTLLTTELARVTFTMEEAVSSTG
mmetsp:Transcript_8261/g.20828  ORF Transcript_8261/g.20828 Transcript_8261/m.20828 type:complete len:263 (-) Transcript_8261:77-865(-)